MRASGIAGIGLAGVVCAGAGVAIAVPLVAPTVVYSGSYVPLTRGTGLALSVLALLPLAMALVALGAGTAGAALAAALTRRPRRVTAIVLGAVGIVLAGAGVALRTTGAPPAAFGWTGYSPLSSLVYAVPVDPWSLPASLVLLALGAGTVGAALAALLASRRLSPGAG